MAEKIPFTGSFVANLRTLPSPACPAIIDSPPAFPCRPHAGMQPPGRYADLISKLLPYIE
jgi:hypothetical protein